MVVYLESYLRTFLDLLNFLFQDSQLRNSSLLSLSPPPPPLKLQMHSLDETVPDTIAGRLPR